MRLAALALLALLCGCGGLGSRIDLSRPAGGTPPTVAMSEPTYPLGAQAADPSPARADSVPRERTVEDPGSPGWSITETELGAQHIHLRLVLDRLHTGGDGDVRQIVARRGAVLARERGLAGFEILRLEQGVSSGWIFGRRVAEAEIRLIASGAWPAI